MGRLRVFSFLSPRGSSKNKIVASAPTSASTPDLPTTLRQAQTFSINGANTSPPENVPNPEPTPTKKPNRLSRPVSNFFAPKQPSQTQSKAADLSTVAQGENGAVPELEPIFGYINNQAAKLYQEGYFLKLNDLDTHGRPSSDRQWVECFGQLVGTVLSIWNAAALDAAGPNVEVPPSFINLADATIQMMESLPTRSQGNKPLKHVISINTAGKNRYLFHFDSLHALTQWTAAIRLTMFEHSLLQESYTGALIAGKGKSINGIKMILEKTTFKYEDWARVRFSPGTPWRRCWCVISQADEKEIQKYNKSLKKKSAYDRPPPPPKGDIKFYDTKKTKKAKPIATITNAYSAYAVYPQSRPLIDQSTLVKVEGQITIHSESQASADGFVFILPELHHAVSGFEMMLRWLFPAYDAFRLYGRPTRLLADTVSPNSLMFAMSTNKRNGYLDILDVSALIHTQGSETWGDREWRKQLKDATARRMTTAANSRESSIGPRGGKRSSLPTRGGTGVRFGATTTLGRNNEAQSSSDTTIARHPASSSDNQMPGSTHSRALSETTGLSVNRSLHERNTPPSPKKPLAEVPEQSPPQPPAHNLLQYDAIYAMNGTDSRSSPDSDFRQENAINRQEVIQSLQPSPPPQSVMMPPAFSHSPGQMPQYKPQPSPDIGRAANRMSVGTLDQLVDINNMHGLAVTGLASSWNENERPGPTGTRGGIERPAIDTNTHTLTQKADSITNSSSVYSPRTPISPPVEVGQKIDGSPARNSLPATPQRSPKKVLSLDTAHIPERKPLPQEEHVPESPSTATPSSLGSFRNAIDIDALNRIINSGPPASPPRLPQPRSQPIPREETESVYDSSSVVSPDYASSHKSSISKRSVKPEHRPRMGKMKTVGNAEIKVEDVVIGDARYKPAAEMPKAPNPDIPMVDFGPTHSYNPTTRRPSTSDTLNLLTHNRNNSQNSLGLKENRMSTGVLGANFNFESQPASQGHERKRSVLWQPGMVADTPDGVGNGISPEEFVQQRASGNRVVSPARMSPYSSSRNSPSPRPASGDWTAYMRSQTMHHDLPPRPHSRGASVMLGRNEVPSRPNSRGPSAILGSNDIPSRPNSRGAGAILSQSDMPPRPSSRGAGVMLEGPPRPLSRGAGAMLHNDISPQLSAREQEHVARMTGSSLLNFNDPNRSHGPQFGAGLVSTIDIRERERRAMKQGVGGQTVQNAIAQRQAQLQHAPQPPAHYAIPPQYPYMQPLQHMQPMQQMPQMPQGLPMQPIQQLQPMQPPPPGNYDNRANSYAQQQQWASQYRT
ncbi:hypothetical protein FQN57_002028 [Myotisia sp. PD_48]|nr:hypothetical protein FQN57_002028 [Myotisia sp. PD_48]